MGDEKPILEQVLDHEGNRANQIFFTQPVGNCQVIDQAWAQARGQARRRVTHPQRLDAATVRAR